MIPVTKGKSETREKTAKGLTGDTGDKGEVGDKGETGDKGVTGDTEGDKGDNW